MLGFLNLNDDAINAIFNQKDAKFNGVQERIMGRNTPFIETENGISLPIIINENNNTVEFTKSCPKAFDIAWTGAYNDSHRQHVVEGMSFTLSTLRKFISEDAEYAIAF